MHASKLGNSNAGEFASSRRRRDLPLPQEWKQLKASVDQIEQQKQRNGQLHLRYCTLLTSCAEMKALAQGERLHHLILRDGIDPSAGFVGAKLIRMYVSCGCIDRACAVFEKLQERRLVVWTLMITAFAQRGQYTEALCMFRRMQQTGVSPDKITLIRAVGAAAGYGDLKVAKGLDAAVQESGYGADAFVATAVVNMYGKCGSIEDARRAFDAMVERDAVAWTSMVNLYVDSSEPASAMLVFRRMLLEGVEVGEATMVAALNSCSTTREAVVIHSMATAQGYHCGMIVGTALVDMYGRCGQVEEARAVFDGICERDVVLWTAMIGAYAGHGCRAEAFSVFEEMKACGTRPNFVTYLALATACSGEEALPQARLVHAKVVEEGYYDTMVNVANAIVSMYGRCGSLHEAFSAFDRVGICRRSVVTWNAMIEACVSNNSAANATAVFAGMVQEGRHSPNSVTFLTLLTMCSHGGMIKQGCELFVSMLVDHDVLPGVQHYSCIVDMLGRAGRLDEAEAIVARMPVAPDDGIWACLMGGCSSYGDLRRGKKTAREVLRLDPEKSEAYVFLSNSLIIGCK